MPIRLPPPHDEEFLSIPINRSADLEMFPHPNPSEEEACEEKNVFPLEDFQENVSDLDSEIVIKSEPLDPVSERYDLRVTRANVERWLDQSEAALAQQNRRWCWCCQSVSDKDCPHMNS